MLIYNSFISWKILKVYPKIETGEIVEYIAIKKAMSSVMTFKDFVAEASQQIESMILFRNEKEMMSQTVTAGVFNCNRNRKKV